MIVSRDRDTAGFSVVAEANDRDYDAEILALLAGGEWWTPAEVNAPKAKGGIGANRETVAKTLDHLVIAQFVEYAKGPPGKAANANCYRLHDGSCKPVQAVPRGRIGCFASPLLPRRGRGSGAGADPRLHEDGAR